VELSSCACQFIPMSRRTKRTRQDSLSTVDVLSLRLTNTRKRKDLLKQLNVKDLLDVLKDALEHEEGVSIEDLVSGILDSLPSTVCFNVLCDLYMVIHKICRSPTLFLQWK
jgi:hypothetical protein